MLQCVAYQDYQLTGPRDHPTFCQAYQMFTMDKWRLHVKMTVVISGTMCTSAGGDEGRLSLSVVFRNGTVTVTKLPVSAKPTNGVNCSIQTSELVMDPRLVDKLNFTFACVPQTTDSCDGSGSSLTMMIIAYRSGSFSLTSSATAVVPSASASTSAAASASATLSSSRSVAASLSVSLSVTPHATSTRTQATWGTSSSLSATDLSLSSIVSSSSSDSSSHTHAVSATQNLSLTQTPSQTLVVGKDAGGLSLKEGSDIALGVVSTMLAGLAPSPASSQIVLGASQCALPPGAEPAVSNAMYMISPFYGSSWGMALGNSLLAAGVTGTHVLLAWCAARRAGSATLDVSALCRTRFPHWSLMFLTITVQGTLVGAAGCFFDGGPLIAVAVVGVGLGAAPTVIAAAVRARFVRPSGAQLERLERAVALSGKWFAPVLPTHFWGPAATRLRFAACFSAMHSLDVAWWLAVPSFVVPLAFAFVGGIEVAVEDRGVVCNIALGIGIAVLGIAMVCCAWLRPYRYPLRNVMCVGELGLLAVATIFTLRSVRESVGETTANNVTASMSLVQMGVVCLQCVYVGVVTVTVDCPPHDDLVGPKTVDAPLTPLSQAVTDDSGMMLFGDDGDEMLAIAVPPLAGLQEEQVVDVGSCGIPPPQHTAAEIGGACGCGDDALVKPPVARGSSSKIDFLREFYRVIDGFE